MSPRLLDTCAISLYLNREAPARTPGLVERVDGILADGGPRIAAITLFELHCGLADLRSRGEGRRKIFTIERFLSTATVLGLDVAEGRGWIAAAELRARCARQSPAITLSHGDLLVAATAAFYGLTLFTTDRRLGDNLDRLGVAVEAHDVA